MAKNTETKEELFFLEFLNSIEFVDDNGKIVSLHVEEDKSEDFDDDRS